MFYSKIRQYFIGNRLQATDDVFEKSRINLVYNFTVFISLLAIPFISQLIVGEFWYHLGINLFEVSALITIFILFRTKVSIRTIGIVFIGMDIVMSVGSLILQNAIFEVQAALWSMVLILYTFFVLGKKWGIPMSVFFILLFIGCQPFGPHEIVPLNFNIPADQVIPTESVFLAFPFLLITYLLTVFINTRNSAEKLISEQKSVLQTQHEEKVSSITYARRIQHAILPQSESITRNIPLSFILYQPRDIVSGDFYWFHEIDRDNYIIVCADCTGHGVPGALMTVVGSNLLNQIITENRIYDPETILLELDQGISATLKQQKLKDDFVADGMDLSLLKVDKIKKEYQYVGAKRPAIVISNAELNQLSASRFSLGGMQSEEKKFESVTIAYKEDDLIYLFTDGFIDQFGGPDNKKFMVKRLRQLLLSIQDKSMPDQYQILHKSINDWIGQQEQTDDITLIGIRF